MPNGTAGFAYIPGLRFSVIPGDAEAVSLSIFTGKAKGRFFEWYMGIYDKRMARKINSPARRAGGRGYAEFPRRN
jgi:hypothetical protein